MILFCTTPSRDQRMPPKITKRLGLTQWQNKWQINFNAEKCFVLRFTHTRQPYILTNTMNNNELLETTSHTYLGVDLSNSLIWNSHIDRITAKANRALGFVRMNIYDCPRHIKEQAYKTLVRPVLDYSASMCYPHEQSNIKEVEAMQNLAARFKFGDYRRRSSVTQMKKELECEDLKIRRTFSGLSIFKQAITGHLITITATTSLCQVKRNPRHSSQTANSFIPINTRKDWNTHFSPHPKMSLIGTHYQPIKPRSQTKTNSNPLSTSTSQPKNSNHLYLYCAPPILFGLTLLWGVKLYWRKRRSLHF